MSFEEIYQVYLILILAVQTLDLAPAHCLADTDPHTSVLPETLHKKSSHKFVLSCVRAKISVLAVGVCDLSLSSQVMYTKVLQNTKVAFETRLKFRVVCVSNI